jgi:hypothetical protein
MKKKIFRIEKIQKTSLWSQEDDNNLLNIVYSFKKRRNWKQIGNVLRRKPNECYLRFKSIDSKIVKGNWTLKEDRKLLKLHCKYGNQWAKIRKCFPNRNAQQIRDRYVNYLNSNISKSKFTLMEDIKILSLHNIYGNQWSLIQTHIPNRSCDMIKNRYNSSIARKKNLLK